MGQEYHQNKVTNRLSQFQHFVHRRLFWLLLCCYVLAAGFPQGGEVLRNIQFGVLPGTGGSIRLTLPIVLLSLLLINAGLGARTEELQHTVRRPLLLLAGITANALLPVVY